VTSVSRGLSKIVRILHLLRQVSVLWHIWYPKWVVSLTQCFIICSIIWRLIFLLVELKLTRDCRYTSLFGPSICIYFERYSKAHLLFFSISKKIIRHKYPKLDSLKSSQFPLNRYSDLIYDIEGCVVWLVNWYNSPKWKQVRVNCLRFF
jgi:hypothetical protein